MKIKEIMTAPASTTRPEESIREAAKKLAADDIGVLPVVSDTNEPVGILTDRDIVLRVVAEGKDPSEPVRTAMTPDVVACTVDTDVTEAAKLMREHKVRRVVATENGALVGIASMGDVARHTKDEHLIAETLETVSS